MVQQSFIKDKKLGLILDKRGSRLCKFLNFIPDAILLVNQKGKIIYSNKMVSSLFGYKREELIGEAVEILIPISSRHKHISNRKDVVAHPRNRPMNTGIELCGQNKKGKKFPVDVSLNYHIIKDELIFLCVIRDISRQKKTEMEIIQQRQQLQALTDHVQNILESERTHIAREIHDELGVQLSALKMDINWLRKNIPAVSENSSNVLVEKLNSMNEMINVLVTSVRKISAELRPGILDELGLIPAVEWFLKEFQKRSGIKCLFLSNKKNIELNKNKTTAVFRIFQESLTNIARHAEAKNVNVVLTANKKDLNLEVIDDGKGITREEITAFRSLGLLGMKERALSVGGNVKLNGGKSGTKVSIEIPL